MWVYAARRFFCRPHLSNFAEFNEDIHVVSTYSVIPSKLKG
jgi:hypothetical protein